MRVRTWVGCLCLALLVACGGEEKGPDYDRAAAFEALGIPGAKTEAEFAEKLDALGTVPIDPPPDVGKDYFPEFPPDLPFDPSEWETNEPGPSISDPRAKKGGKVILAYPDWPPTIRSEGPNSRLSILSSLHTVVYETLLGFDAVRMEYVPNLATHWQVSDDKMVYRFRIDERARWADGREVTADDVVATVEHLLNPDRKDPLVQRQWDEMIEYARMLDKYTVEVKTREPRWRSMILIAAAMNVYPAAYIRMDGATYLEDWNWKLPPGTGAYEIRPEDIRKGVSITLHRRKDWWQKDHPGNEGTANFDEIVWKIVRDQELQYQKMLAGEIDIYRVGRAQRWVDELDRERVIQMGWVQKRKIYNKVPRGYGGFCFNVRTQPFDDRNVRLAFAHLYNREKLFAKLLFYQYEYTDSYFPAQAFARPNADRIHYDPEKARELLAKSGWTKRDAEGYLINERGERFPVLKLEYGQPSFQRIFEVPRHDLWNEAGIKLELKVLDYASLLKKVWDYKFQLVYWSWTANLFPDPNPSFHSKYADPKQTNNLNGFKNEEADKIMDAYRFEFDAKKRQAMLQQLDQILFDSHIYALGWYAPYFRIIYWDKFGHPPEYQARSTRDWINIMLFWWYEPERAKRTLQNKKDGVPNYPDSEFALHQYDEPDRRWWIDNDLPMPDEPEQGK